MLRLLYVFFFFADYIAVVLITKKLPLHVCRHIVSLQHFLYLLKCTKIITLESWRQSQVEIKRQVNHLTEHYIYVILRYACYVWIFHLKIYVENNLFGRKPVLIASHWARIFASGIFAAIYGVRCETVCGKTLFEKNRKFYW